MKWYDFWDILQNTLVRTEVEWGIERDGLNKIDELKLLIVKADWHVRGSSLYYPLYFLYVWNFQQSNI